MQNTIEGRKSMVSAWELWGTLCLVSKEAHPRESDCLIVSVHTIENDRDRLGDHPPIFQRDGRMKIRQVPIHYRMTGYKVVEYTERSDFSS